MYGSLAGGWWGPTRRVLALAMAAFLVLGFMVVSKRSEARAASPAPKRQALRPRLGRLASILRERGPVDGGLRRYQF